MAKKRPKHSSKNGNVQTLPPLAEDELKAWVRAVSSDDIVLAKSLHSQIRALYEKGARPDWKAAGLPGPSAFFGWNLEVSKRKRSDPPPARPTDVTMVAFRSMAQELLRHVSVLVIATPDEPFHQDVTASIALLTEMQTMCPPVKATKPHKSLITFPGFQGAPSELPGRGALD